MESGDRGGLAGECRGEKGEGEWRSVAGWRRGCERGWLRESRSREAVRMDKETR